LSIKDHIAITIENKNANKKIVQMEMKAILLMISVYLAVIIAIKIKPTIKTKIYTPIGIEFP
jgi:hypothetical protein